MNSTMRGTLAVPFSELFADTLGKFGEGWAFRYYTSHGMSLGEFDFWLLSYVLTH